MPSLIKIIWQGSNRNAGNGTLRTVSGTSENVDNTDESPNTVKMITKNKALTNARKISTWCIPAHSVFSIVEP